MKLIQLAEEAVKGSGDGRISKNDAEQILAAVVDGDVYTETERETVDYLHKNFHWTDAAWSWFNEQLKIWSSEFQKLIRMTPAEVTKQHFAVEDVLRKPEERIAREHDLKAATTETYQDHDDIAIIVRLANGRRVEVISNFIELAGSFVELRGGFDIPVKAIEKVEI